MQKEDSALPASQDAELVILKQNALPYINRVQLDAYISVVTRFNRQPVTIVDGDGETNNRIIYQYNLRRDLAALPAYFNAADRAGLSGSQAFDLLCRTMKAVKYEFTGTTSLIESLTGIFDISAERNIALPIHLNWLHDAVELIREEGEAARILSIFNFGLKAGLRIADITPLIGDICRYAPVAGGYGLMALYNELNGLSTNNADPEILYKALRSVIGTSGYGDLSNMLYQLFTGTSLSQDDVLAAVALDGPIKSWTDQFSDAARALLDRIDVDPALNIKKSPDLYFPDIDARKLRHGLMPYRITHSFADGIGDLAEAMHTELSEGMFIFDPQHQIWYAHGGTTDAQSGRIRHEFASYDLSRLTDTAIAAHVHPLQGEIFVAPPRDCLAEPRMIEKLTKLCACMPSRADYTSLAAMIEVSHRPLTLTSMIVTSSGLMVMEIPQDVARLRDMAESFQDFKDDYILNYDADDYVVRGGLDEPTEDFVQRAVRSMNAQMPHGFGIKLMPYDQVTARPMARRRLNLRGSSLE